VRRGRGACEPVRLTLISFAWCAALLAGERARGAAPVGSELQVNTYTVGAQRFASVAASASGDFVVAWHSPGQDGDARGVFARRFASSGAPQGGELQVNTFTPGDQYYARVARAAGGQFVVTWQSVGQDGDSNGIFARRFDSSGAAVGGELQVNTRTAGLQGFQSVAMGAGGDFVVVWNGPGDGITMGAQNGIFAARFDADGEPLGGELQVNVFTANNQSSPELAIDGDGDFVVVWRSNQQDGDNQGVFARRFVAAGTPVGGEFQVNLYTPGAQQLARVAFASDGDFVIAWQSPQDGGSDGVFARRFREDGAPLATEFQVNTYTLAFQNRPSVGVVDGSGGFVVTWHDSTQDGSFNGIFARLFDSSGTATTPEFQVNTHTDLYQLQPMLATQGGGDFVVTWMSLGQDGDAEGIFAQRFAGLVDFDVDGNGLTAALTDGLLILRYMFGLRGDALVDAAVGAGCTRCDATSIEAFLAAHL
jgi:hypothetical protein